MAMQATDAIVPVAKRPMKLALTRNSSVSRRESSNPSPGIAPSSKHQSLRTSAGMQHSLRGTKFLGLHSSPCGTTRFRVNRFRKRPRRVSK